MNERIPDVCLENTEVLNREEALELIGQLTDTAEEYVPLESTEENIETVFSSGVRTILGEVSFKDYQKDKIRRTDRSRFLGIVRPVLESPSFVVRKIGGSDDGSDAFEFFKIFSRRGKDGKWFMSAVVHKEGSRWESVSSHVSKIGQARSRLMRFPLAYSAVAENQQAKNVQRQGSPSPDSNLPSDSPSVNEA